MVIISRLPIIFALAPAVAQDGLDPLVVTARRLPLAESDSPFALTELDRERLSRSPGLELDEILANEVPGFSLFRRTPARAAHPTTQGLSLRNLGPNGAGRTLVLLDGLPLNDPFGGWVNWQRVPPGSLERVLVRRGGGAGLHGNAALAGTLFLESRDPSPGDGEVTLTAGTDETYLASAQGGFGSGAHRGHAFVRHFETGGFPILRADQRGPVDTDSDVEASLFQTRFLSTLTSGSELEFLLAAFREDRTNGTRLAANASRGVDLSAAWTRELDAGQGRARAQIYYQNRRFESLFTAVADDRASERPALDQFDVPSESTGGSLTWAREAGNHRLVMGADFRWVSGETRENYFFNGGGFLRNRVAGGEQTFAGIFIEDRWRLSDELELTSGIRIDHVRNRSGSRVERDRLTGEVLTSRSFEDRDHLVPNGQLGLIWQPDASWRWRAAAVTGFRQPTLNELYRPFRVGDDITEANAALDPERLIGLEGGVDWTPAPEWTFELGAFFNRLTDAVGNVTLAEGPGQFEIGGFVPAGGVLRQRRNLERVEVAGIEAGLAWEPRTNLAFTIDYLFTHAEIAAADSPDLVGRRLAQAPRHVGIVGFEWQPAERWWTRLQTRVSSSQDEDDLNTLELGGYATVDAAIGWQPMERLQLQLAVRNLFDREIETGRRASGLVSIGPPRQIELSLSHLF